MTEGAAPAKAPGIARTALLLLPLQVIFRGGEAVLPLLLAAWFGRSTETDLYYLLAAYFVFAASLLTGAFQDSAVVPVLIEVERKEPAQFPVIAGSLFGHTLALGAGTGAVALVLAAGFALALSSLPGLALALSLLMSLALFTTAVRAFYMGLLNARGHFYATPFASGVAVAVVLGSLFSSRGVLGVRAIPLSMLAGDLVAILLLAWLCRRGVGFWVSPNLARPEPVRRIFKLVRLEVTGSVITRINPVIDQLMAGLAGVVGGGTLLRYANDVASLPTSIIQATVLPVFLTRVAHDAGDLAKMASTTRRTLAAVVALLVALSLGFFFLRGPLVRILFLHGAMDQAGADRIVAILPWGLLGVAPFGALLVLARTHVALQNSRIMPSMGVLNSSLNAVFNLLLVFSLGLSGIALSTSLTYVVLAVVFWFRLPRALRT